VPDGEPWRLRRRGAAWHRAGALPEQSGGFLGGEYGQTGQPDPLRPSYARSWLPAREGREDEHAAHHRGRQRHRSETISLHRAGSLRVDALGERSLQYCG
jgi:hypothetical protein